MPPKDMREESICVEGFEVTVRYKKVKNINLRILQSGKIAVSAPCTVKLSRIEEFVRDKKPWIERTLADIANSPQMAAETASARELARWKDAVSTLAPPLIAYWEAAIGVRAKTIVYRNMRSRWGSCQPATGRICLNTRLALYPATCLEYVIVHELCHLVERGHGQKFKALLGKLLPDWKERKALLR